MKKMGGHTIKNTIKKNEFIEKSWEKERARLAINENKFNLFALDIN